MKKKLASFCLISFVFFFSSVSYAVDVEKLMDTETVEALSQLRGTFTKTKLNTGFSQRLCLPTKTCKSLYKVLKSSSAGYDYFVVDRKSSGCNESRCGSGKAEFSALLGVLYTNNSNVYPKVTFRVIPKEMRSSIQVIYNSGTSPKETMDICKKRVELLKKIQSGDLKVKDLSCVADGSRAVELNYTINMKEKMKFK